MLTQVRLMPCIAVLDPITKAVAVNEVIHIMDGDTKIADNLNQQVFAKGQLEELKAFIGVQDSPEIAYITQLWA